MSVSKIINANAFTSEMHKQLFHPAVCVCVCVLLMRKGVCPLTHTHTTDSLAPPTRMHEHCADVLLSSASHHNL